MKEPVKNTVLDDKSRQLIRLGCLLIAFLVLTVGIFYALRALKLPEGTALQQGVFTLGGALLLAGLGTATVAGWQVGLRGTEPRRLGVWTCPLMAAGISLCLFILGYAYLGVWPLGENSVMLVDMHHQYAPLLSELRHMLLEGLEFPFTFHIGLGANFFPAFAYYLSSPLNLLLLLFPESWLTEGILVITLLKNALAAGAFAAMAQYLYKRRDARIIALSVMYSLMMYMLAYSWNIMWLDVVALLPLIILAMEHMLNTGKYLPYSLLLALALFANYYIGFMLCVFLVLYMVLWYVRRPQGWLDAAKAGGRFAGASLLGGGLAAAILVPTALALGRTSAAGDEFPAFASNFALFDWVGQLFYGAEPTIRSGNLPNLYCGVLVVLLLPLYFMQQHIPVRRRLGYGGLLAVMLLSCTVNQWDLVWHGLHAPNDLPYRFSFLCCFVMLLIAGYVLTRLHRIQPRQLLISLAASAVYLIIWEKFGGDKAPNATLLYGNLLLLGLYAAILAAGAARRMPRRATALLLLTVVCAELMLSNADALTAMDSNEYYTIRNDYVANTATEADRLAIERAQELATEEGNTFGAFSRLEYLPRDTCMDTSLHHYNGITSFASSNSYALTLLMGDLGYAVNGVNSYLYHSYVPAVDSLLGIRYLVLENDMDDHPQLKLVDTVTTDSTTRYIYKIEQALPLGYFADNDLSDYRTSEYAPFLSQQQLYDCLVGEEKTIYTYLTPTAEGDGTITGTAFHIPEHMASETFTATVEEEGQYYAFIDCRAAQDITVHSYTADGTDENTWSVSTYEPYIIDMGTLTPGQTVEATISSEDGSVSGNVYFARLNKDNMDAQLAILAQGGLKVTDMSNGHITGSVTAPESGLVFYTLPYDSGWSATVDGKKAVVVPIGGSKEDAPMLAVRVTAGQHEVTLTYKAPGQTAGLLITVASALVILVPLVLQWVRRKRMAK